MKDRGKAVEVYINDFVQDYSTSSSDLFCKKHPQSSSAGICAYCLKDRLANLVCSDCGEQRGSSSCSCSEINSNPRISCTGEVGSVGRVSFLIENENKEQHQSLLNLTSSNSKSKSGGDKAEDVFFLKRSNSSCVEIKRKNGFWRFGRLFRKKRDKDMIMNLNEKNDMWVVDYNGVSRSRSMCSFRGGGFFGSEDGGDSMNFSGARSSSISAARSSSVMGGLSVDPDRKSGFSEPRESGFDSDKRDSTFVESDVVDAGFSSGNSRMFSLKESYFSGGDDSGFIDLKFELQSESKGVSDNPAFGSMRAAAGGGGGGSNSIQNGLVGGDGSNSIQNGLVGGDGSNSIQNGLIGDDGGSCRVTVNERGIKRSRKNFKGWRWIFKHNSDWSSSRKKIGDLMVNH